MEVEGRFIWNRKMATGGGHAWPSSTSSSYSDRTEEPSRKHAVIKAFFDRLVKEAGPKLRDLVDKLREKGAITPQQRENVVKTLRQQHLEKDYAPSLLFEIILKSVENDDINFDRLLLSLRDVELGDLADELYHNASVTTPPHQEDHEMEHDNAHYDDDRPSPGQPTSTSSEKMGGEEMSMFDSGIIAPQSFTLPDSSSTSASVSDNSDNNIMFVQPELVVNQPRLDVATPDQQFTPPLQESHSEEETVESGSTNEEHTDTDVPMVQPDNFDASLQSHPQLQEPAEVDEVEVEDQQVPIQAHNEQSNALLLVPNTNSNYTSVVEEVSGTSSNEELVDHLSHRLNQLCLELQIKEQ